MTRGISHPWWTPSIAVSGIAFYTGDRLAKWKGDLFVGGLRQGEIIGTGQIQRVLLNERMEELRREALPTDWRHRMRDVRQGPEGLLYVLVDDEDGAILRIEPAERGFGWQMGHPPWLPPRLVRIIQGSDDRFQ